MSIQQLTDHGAFKYADVYIRKYKTQCCSSSFYWTANTPIRCIKCNKEVHDEVESKYKSLLQEFEYKLRDYQNN